MVSHVQAHLIVPVPRFGHHGTVDSRLEHLRLQNSCRCHRRTCFQQLKGLKQALLQFLSAFWSMTKHVQDEFLRSTIMESEGNTRCRKTGFLLGKLFGPKCCLAVLGVGNCRVLRVTQGRFDRRFAVWGAPCQKPCFFLFILPVCCKTKGKCNQSC